MRAFSTGDPFLEVASTHHIPNDDDVDEMQTDIAVANSDRRMIPVFTEAYLYPRLGKEDARFVLAVADEYTRLIDKLGTDEIHRLLREED